jgi:large subunit ribosomal protein L4
MEAKLLSLDNKVVGKVALNDAIFGLEARIDIIKRVVDWQRAKAMSGTHQTKTVGEVAGTGKKPFKQKGTGNARQGNAQGVQRRGGGIAFGPVTRSHETSLQKKVRRLGMRHALSIKFSEGAVHIIDSTKMNAPKTSELVKSLSNFGPGKFFIIDGKEVDQNIKLSAKSAINTNVVPVIGANVYDIVNSDHILISKDALPFLEERLK